MVGALVALTVVSAFFWGPTLAERVSVGKASAACEANEKSDAEKVDCWLQIVFQHLRKDGILSAYRAFGYLYETYPVFGATGCHSHAHKVGETAYFELSVARGIGIEQMDFPQETTSCGYGFFHGFIEHYIQDRPQSALVTETCEYLRGRLSGTMRDIGTICYHASGHGFTQAKAGALKKSELGNLYATVDGPLNSCETLSKASDKEIEDCREGVFNVISDWMSTKDFGFFFDYERPFFGCDLLPQRWHYACYYEFGQKLQPITGDKPLEAAKLASSIPNKKLREMTFGVMVAGMMQRQAPLDGHRAVLTECEKITDEGFFRICVRSLVNGMMEHGNPGKEYEKILPLCEGRELVARGGTKICYETLARRLSRFYPPAKKAQICAEFPKNEKDFCEKTL